MRLCFTTPTPFLLRRASRFHSSSSHHNRSLSHSSRNGRPRSVVCRALSTASLESATTTKIPPSSSSPNTAAPTFQDAVRLLQDYWSKNGCLVWHPYNTEVGAGTMNPATFLRVLGPEPWSVAYEEPSIRPDDSRYGENPNRLQRHTQFQVIIKPASKFSQELVLGSYKALGIDIEKQDIRFVEDNWASPALGAWGLGWEIWLNGMEITQFTYFQQAGSVSLDTISVEITYGLERIVMALQEKQHFKDIIFANNISYGEIFMQSEFEMSKYNLDDADIQRNTQFFDHYEAEALMLLEKRLPVPAYSYLLKASHTFNILDARGAIGVTERARFFQRMRALSRNVAKLWLERREEMQFPLLVNSSAPLLDSTALKNAPAPVTKSPPPLNEKEDFVLEIGVEELPPNDLTSMMKQVELSMEDILKKASLSYESLKISGTPRRVAISVKHLQTKQQDTSLRVRGPPLSIAIDKNGENTKAALGFLRKQGGTEAEVELDEKEGYMYITVERKGLSAQDVLSDSIVEMLSKISFGKTMRWNDSNVVFSRPIRWLLCMLGTTTIPVEYAGITSGPYSRSLRGSDGFAKDIPIDSAASYETILEGERYEIMLDMAKRYDVITRESERLAESIGGKLVEDEELFNEVANLVENPIPILGRFNEEFLELPQEVLMSVMKKHQRYFSIKDSTGKLMDAFITVVNGNSTKVDLDAIRKGNEAVLRARYSDARFFYENDTRDGKTLKEFVPLLDRLTFQENLGSMLDKTNRVVAAIPEVFKYLDTDDTIAKEAAVLIKADLATSMVVEMTSLAGIMGTHYAEKSGETSTPEVARVILDAALPRYSGDILPESKTGAILGVMDRLDSLLALFSVGLAPKSTADPFALRRAALGTVQILVTQGISADIGELLGMTKAQLLDTCQPEESVDTVLQFVEKRLEGFLLDTQNIRPDVVKATLAVGENARNPYVCAMTAQTVQQMLGMEGDRGMVEEAAEVYGRTVRMLRSINKTAPSNDIDIEIDTSLFESDEERNLLHALEDFTVYGDEGLRERIVKFAGLKAVVDAFFDGVFVAADDKAVRKNRTVLCARLAGLIGDHVDLSLLQI